MILETSDYKDFLNITSNDFETLIQTIASGCEADIVRFLGYDPAQNDYVEVFSGKGYEALVIPHRNVTTVSKIEKWNGSAWVELLQGSDYTRLVIEHGCIVYCEDMKFEAGRSNYRISYTAGWLTIPADMSLAFKRLTKLRWDETPMGRNSLGVSSVSENGGINNSTNIDKDDEKKVYKSIEGYANTNV